VLHITGKTILENEAEWLLNSQGQNLPTLSVLAGLIADALLILFFIRNVE